MWRRAPSPATSPPSGGRGARRHTWFLATALLIFSARCNAVPRSDTPCNAAPAGKVVTFLENEPRPIATLHATVDRIIEAEKSWTYVLRDESGVRRLSYRAPEPMPSIVAGHAYDFQIEYVGGYPAASGIVVRDERGLLFAAATDQQPFQHVLKNGIEGFDIAMSDAGCPSRSHERCYDAVFNQQLRIARGKSSALLANGQSATVGGHRIHVLTAQRVVYNKSCADAGLVGVSFTVTREK